jgi:hypothetical protein
VRADVAVGSKGNLTILKSDSRFTLNNDIIKPARLVGFAPEADACRWPTVASHSYFER